jgi:hypothetical protein
MMPEPHEQLLGCTSGVLYVKLYNLFDFCKKPVRTELDATAHGYAGSVNLYAK